jgi:autotransporter-associated beta strand protein
MILDDNGFTLSIGSAALADGGGGGGLLKKGSGAVYLDAANLYTGLTIVTNGTLAGIGSVAGSVIVPSTATANGNLGAGDAPTNGIFTIGGNLTLGKNTTIRVNKTAGVITNDQIAVTGSITFGGVLNIINITGDGTPLAVGNQFQIFNQGGANNFSSIVSSGATYTFAPATGILTVASIGPGTFTNPTDITGMNVQNGTNLVINASNGQAGDAYYLLESTNVATPIPQWKTVATNVLSVSGPYTFIGTNVVVPGSLLECFLLSNTNYNP